MVTASSLRGAEIRVAVHSDTDVERYVEIDLHQAKVVGNRVAQMLLPNCATLPPLLELAKWRAPIFQRWLRASVALLA